MLVAAWKPALASFLDINPAVAHVELEQAHAVLCIAGHHEGDDGIQGHGVPQLVLK